MGGPTLVVGHGRDASSDHALRAAIDLAARLGGRLHVVHVIDLRDYPLNVDAPDWEQRGAEALAEEQRHVEGMLADAGVSWTYEARHGEPAKALCTAAEELDAYLIVVGSRGEGLRRAISRLVDPSISHGVLRHQRRPVLVVPAHD
ncbi:MAG TPA: universal stress protein [Pseudonocardia sp.]|jgi:nucleotide-binding universal stress UspA family protein|uniref:universal stress protein n=1 Tax=Pseudonocardia sp. TaxID=60912 RepID=UPI002B4ACB4A|nr:universal stress protein [Pseudonocardia sp.]HLU56597.1 universal stress protein [Pseudonocardia sp.]